MQSLIGQGLLRLAFPPQCIGCGMPVEAEFGLCGACWRETPFVSGLVCDCCGLPLMGQATSDRELCDDCMTIARPWIRGRAALIYRDRARALVLGLKHGDRLDLVRPAARWMAGAGATILTEAHVLVPVPVHRWRLVSRRYNQAAELARALAKITGNDCLPGLLRRVRRTGLQDGKTRDQRFANLVGAIHPAPGAGAMLAGRPVMLVDDVMTSGATLAASADACLAAGADHVDVLVLARVDHGA